MSYGEERISEPPPPVQAAEALPEPPPAIRESEPPASVAAPEQEATQAPIPALEPEPPPQAEAPLAEVPAMARAEEEIQAPEPSPPPPPPERTEPVSEAAPVVSPPTPEEQLVTEPPIAEIIPETPTQPSPAGPVGEPAPAITQPIATITLDDVYFDFDRFLIRDDAQPTLEANAKILTQADNGTILIEGHCDERGTISYNLLLGERRARAVQQYLIDLGIPVSRIEIVSYGKERPFCSESNEDCWQLNRRAHFVAQ